MCTLGISAVCELGPNQINESFLAYRVCSVLEDVVYVECVEYVVLQCM